MERRNELETPRPSLYDASAMSTRLTKIEVVNLFGVFRHVIPLNLTDRITIIHGPNGYGKTALLLCREVFKSGQDEGL